LDAAVLAQMAENDAMAAFGKVPPDLSLMVKARDGGPNYLYSYLLGYYLTKDGGTRQPYLSRNKNARRTGC
jgi:ubiquinol-cytochrome c reductase cytochrome c1 subunit